jgi:uncharacterized membrane protein
MTRNEYMEQLKKYLKRLPKEDYDNAIEYFSEYFDEAGSENEQQVMEELGEPREAARELLLNLLQESVGGGKDSTGEKTAALPEAGSVVQGRSTAWQNAHDSTKNKRSPGKIILLAILVLCASPVSLVLLISALTVLFAVVVVIASVIFSLGVTSVAAIAGGILLAGFGAMLILKSVAAACMMAGSGFLMAGAGILIGILTIYICKWCATGIGRLVNRFVRKKVRKDE